MTEILFIELIRVAIGTQANLSRCPSEREWDELYKMAEKQSLIGVCFAGLHRLGEDTDEGFARIGMSEMQYLNWMGMAFQIQSQNQLMNRQCAELQAMLFADGMHSCILKGQGVGLLYAEHLHDLRQSGDIDAWIDADREDVIAYVKRTCPKDDVDISSKHIEFSVFDDTVVEAHFVPASSKTPIIGRRVKAYYDGQKARQMEHRVKLASGQEIVAPTNDFQAIHILQHAFGHFLFEGIGMRQLMDYYFVMQQSFSDVEKVSIVKTLKSLKMYRFAQGVAYIVTEVLGAKECFIPADERLGKRILKSVMEEGNFGKYDKKRDSKRMGSSWYRFWYHNIRMWKYFDMAPWTIAMSPLVRIHEYTWRLTHGYFKKVD